MIQINKLEEESKQKNAELDGLSSKLSIAILEKKQLLMQNKKIFDEKFKNKASKNIRKSIKY